MRRFYLQELTSSFMRNGIDLASLTLKGNQEKWQYQQEGLIVKAALFDGFVWWEDWKVEAIAGQLLPRFQIEVLQQSPCRIDDGYGNIIFGCYSKDYRQTRERFYSFYRLLQKHDLVDRFPGLSVPEKIQTAVSLLSAYLEEQQATRFIEDMCLADYMMGNVDRHPDNFGILIKRDNADHIVARRPAPLYDFGMGLFQGMREGLGYDFHAAQNAMPTSPFAIDLHGAYEFYQERWRSRCRGIDVDLSTFDFPKGLAKQYLRHALASLEVKTEG